MWRAVPYLLASALIASSVRAQQPCTPDPNQVVAAMYQQILERNPDSGSRIFMYDIASGRGTVRRNIAELAMSREHQQRFLWPYVAEAAFRATRNARPNDGDIDGAVQALANGSAAVPDVVAAFAASEAMTAPPPMRVLVLYTRLLNREPDESAARYEQMGDRVGVGRLSQVIAHSDEYAQRAGGPHGLPRQAPPQAYAGAIRMLYVHVLGREPDPEGLESASAFAAARGLPEVIPQLVNSPEYMQRFGENGVPGPGSARLTYCGSRR